MIAGLEPKDLVKLAYAKMYFGKYKNWYLSDIPEPYYTWFSQKGFPENTLGKQLKAVHEFKVNGLEGMLKEIRRKYPKPL